MINNSNNLGKISNLHLKIISKTVHQTVHQTVHFLRKYSIIRQKRGLKLVRKLSHNPEVKSPNSLFATKKASNSNFPKIFCF
jgi:hypothetical protein